MLRYSTSDRTVKLIDTKRWKSASVWKQATAKDCDTALDRDTPPKLGVRHPDEKVLRRSRIR